MLTRRRARSQRYYRLAIQTASLTSRFRYAFSVLQDYSTSGALQGVPFEVVHTDTTLGLLKQC